MVSMNENCYKFEVHVVVRFLQVEVIQRGIHCRFTSMTQKRRHSPKIKERKSKLSHLQKKKIGDHGLGLWRPPDEWIFPSKTTINSDKYCETVEKLCEAIKHKRAGWLATGVRLLHDAVQPHTSAQTVAWLQKMKWCSIHHISLIMSHLNSNS